MNPGAEKYEDYVTYRAVLKKIKILKFLDGLELYSDKCLEKYKNKSVSGSITNDSNPKKNLFDFDDGSSKNTGSAGVSGNNNINNNFTSENVDGEIAAFIKSRKRQSSITYSQRMLKKADNLTKFNRKNHSEGNKHITNNDL
jgi:hypothetical protein